MTTRLCNVCGEYVVPSEQCNVCGALFLDPPTNTTSPIPLTATPTPESVGAQIRALLMSLRKPGHTVQDEAGGMNSYATDALRRRALDCAGVCWCNPGEMAPMCCCKFGEADPSEPRRRWQERLTSALEKGDAEWAAYIREALDREANFSA